MFIEHTTYVLFDCYEKIVYKVYHSGSLKHLLNAHFHFFSSRSLRISLKFLALQSEDPDTQTKYQALLSNCYYKSCSASVAIVLDRINHVIGVQTQTAGTGSYIWWHPAKYQVTGILMKYCTRFKIVLFLGKNSKYIVIY